MRFLMLGAGALGGYFGGKLLQGGSEVDFLVRPRRAAQLAGQGLVVKAQDGEIRRPVTTVQAGSVKPGYDAVLLSCKAYDLEDAMTAIAPAIAGNCAILPVLNGVRHIERLGDRFGKQHVCGGLTAVNAALTPAGEIVQSAVRVDMTGFGELDGKVSERCLAVQKAFAAGSMNADASATIMTSMWTKFAGFTCSATVATLMRSRAGAIARAPASRALVAAVIAEVSAVASAEGFPPPPNIADIIGGLFSQTESTYGPSILIDMEEGRATEGEHTIGDMVDRADRHGVAVPILTAARTNLQIYESGRKAT
jgi:2-dehydropantoate 2-reductase